MGLSSLFESWRISWLKGILIFRKKGKLISGEHLIFRQWHFAVRSKQNGQSFIILFLYADSNERQRQWIMENYFFETSEKQESKKLYLLVIYDIIDNKRRLKFAKAMEGYGI